MLRLREFMFERVYLGAGGAARAGRASSACCARCSTTTLEHPPPALTADATEAQRVVDWLAGMTDRFAIRAFEDLSLPQGF